jgi:hypothetical protein
MLSVGPNAPCFSPSQDIRVTSLAFDLLGNVHYRHMLEISSHSGFSGKAGGGCGVSSRIVFLVSR